MDSELICEGLARYRSDISQWPSDPLGFGLFVLAVAGTVLERAACLPGHLLGMVHQSLGEAQRKVLEVLVAHAHRAQEPIHALGVANRTQCSTKPHPVKTSQDSDDILLVALYKGIHGVAPLERLVFFVSIPYTKKQRLSSLLAAAQRSEAAPSSPWSRRGKKIYKKLKFTLTRWVCTCLIVESRG